MNSAGSVNRFSDKFEKFVNTDPVIKVGSSGSRKFEFGGKHVSLNHIIEEFEKEMGNKHASSMPTEKAEMSKKILIRLKELKTNQSPVNNIFSSAMKHLREATNRAFGREERLDALDQKIFQISKNLVDIKKQLTISCYPRSQIFNTKVKFLDEAPDTLFLTTQAGQGFAYIDNETHELMITGMSRDLKTSHTESIGFVKDVPKADIKNLFLENYF